MSSGFIETELSNKTLHIHRALASLQEELEPAAAVALERQTAP